MVSLICETQKKYTNERKHETETDSQTDKFVHQSVEPG